jgi:hypothetical protein
MLMMVETMMIMVKILLFSLVSAPDAVALVDVVSGT